MSDNYDDVSRDGLVDMLQESTDEIQQLRKRLKEFKQVEANYDALQSPMPCGHLARYAVNGEGGTQYCCACLANETQKENGVLRRYIAKLEEEIDEQ